MVAPERVGLIDAVPGADVRRRAITSALITIRLKGSRLTNSKSSNFTLWRVNNMRKILAEYYDENKILIFATILGCLYYFYRKITGTDSWYTGKVLIAVLFSFLFIIFVLKMKKHST